MSAPASILSIVATPKAPSSGAPPGPEPPKGFTIPSAEGVATKEPNAPAQKPDLEPTNGKPALGKSVKGQIAATVAPGQAAIQALITISGASAFSTPTISAPVSTPSVVQGDPVATSAPIALAGTPSILPANSATESSAPTESSVSPVAATLPIPVAEPPIKLQGRPSDPVAPSSLTLPTDPNAPIASVSVSVTNSQSALQALSTPVLIPSLTAMAADVVGIAAAAAGGIVPIESTSEPVTSQGPAQLGAVAQAVVPTVPMPKTAVADRKPMVPSKPESSGEPGATQDPTPKAAIPVARSSASDSDSSNGQAAREERVDKPIATEEPQAPAEPVIGVVPKADLTASSAIQAKPVLSTSHTNAVIQQLTDRIELMAAVKPKDGMTVHLQPSDLGTVSMVVKAVGKTVEAEIFATNPAVRDALETSKTQLAASVQHRGLQLANVTVGSQASTSNTSQQQSQARQMLESNLSDSNARNQQSSARGSATPTGAPTTSSLDSHQSPIIQAIRQGSTFDLAI